MVHTQKRKTLLDNLVTKINNFSLYYEMSDSSSVYDTQNNEKNNIILLLKNINTEELSSIYMNLNYNGKECWTRYFKTN